MLRRLFTVAARSLIFAIICPAVVAEELSEENLKKIAAIDYQGIGFSSSQEDLLRTIPNVELNDQHVGSDKGISTYEVRDDSANDCVLLRFFGGALVEIDFIYFQNRVASKGGPDAITSRAVEEFGPPAMKLGKTLLWDFPTIDRRVIASYENKKWSLHVYHRTRRLGIPGYKDTSVDPKSWLRVTVGPTVPDKSRRAENAARNFSYEGVRLGTTLEEFKGRFPSARVVGSDNSSHTSHYAALVDHERMLTVLFFRGRVYWIQITFNSNELSDIGGDSILEIKMVGTFGRPHAIAGSSSGWEFPKLRRYVLYSFDPGSDSAGLNVIDTAIHEKVQTIKVNNLDLGF